MNVRRTTTQLAWAAGILEGEGCFTFNGSRTPMVALGMTDEDVVRKVQQLLAPDNRIYVRNTQNRKPYYELKIIGKRAAGVMLTLFSFLGRRRRERIKEVLNKWLSPDGRRRVANKEA